jgi:hypothetical protein
MQPSSSRRHVTALCVAAAVFGLCLPGLAGAEPGASSSPDARASLKCGTVKTRNGGRAEFVNTVKATCRIGRRVARRANGRRYRFLGFDCKPTKKRGVPGKLYGCGRFKNGQGQGIGFIYRAP